MPKQNENSPIVYRSLRTPLGWMLAAGTTRGICAIRFGNDRKSLNREFLQSAAGARSCGRDDPLWCWCDRLLEALQGHQTRLDIPLDIRGSSFQRRVWNELRRIPCGATRSYQQVARAIRRPLAVRAVARACATNPVCPVVPCHRVLRSDGSLGGFFWGVQRKRRLLEIERSAARLQS